MEIDPVRPSESRGGRPAEEPEEALPFVSRKKVKVPDKIESVLAEELKDLEEELSNAARTELEKMKLMKINGMGPLEIYEAFPIGHGRKVEKPDKGKAVHAARTERQNSKLTKIVKGMGPLEVEEALSIGHRRKLEKPEKGKAVHEWQPEAELDEALFLAVRSGLAAEEVRKFLRVAVLSNLMDYDVHSLAVKSGLKDEDAVSLAKNFLTMYKIVFRALHAQLLGSFDRRRFDPELCQWKRFGRFFTERKKKGPEGIPFLLFKIKASAKNAKVTWWRKEYSHFPPERSGYTGVLRVARLVIGRDGSPRLEEAGEDGQPGALSHGNGRYTSSAHRVGVLKDGWLSPLDEVAVVRRLPAGEGIYIMSYVDGLGVKLGEFLFVLHFAWTVALSFTERAFYVSSEFTEETLYAVPGVHFIDITIPVEHLIKKLNQMYEQEEQDKKTMLEKQDPVEMMCQQEELGPRLENEERKKEDLPRRKEHKLQRKNKREAFRLVKKATRIQNEQRQNEGYDEDCVRWLEESDWVLPFDEVAKPGEAQRTS